jgi:Predicted epimerase, PhzC/PhzF homolog
MTNLCRENNYSDIAILLKKAGGYDLRWFTQAGEIDFCGHATLAASYAVLFIEEPGADEVHFDSMHGHIVVTRTEGLINMKFESYHLHQIPVTDYMVEATGCTIRPVEAWMDRDLLLVYEDEDAVRNMVPDIEKVNQLDGLLFHVTAPGRDYDCVSRSFGPKCGIIEDPVCGSGHCHIIPYWSNRLGKADIKAFQASRRSGILYGHCEADNITISGHAVLFAKGEAVEENCLSEGAEK